MRLNVHDVFGLRRLADDAQLEGKFDDAETLNELLDAREILFRAEDALELADGPEDVVTACETLAKAFAGLDDGDHDAVIKACSNFEVVRRALELVADDLDSEAGNFDDVQISIAAEVDRLKEIALSPTKDALVELLKVGEAVVNLADVVSTLRGQRNRLNDSAKRAREALNEAGR